jgi:hypothetical protein
MKNKFTTGSYVRTKKNVPISDTKIVSNTTLRIINACESIETEQMVYVLKDGTNKYYAWIGEMDENFFEVL